jgi:hypothetical protein
MREAIKLHPVPTVPTVPRVEETILTHSRRKCRPWHNSGGALGHNVMEQTEPTQRVALPSLQTQPQEASSLGEDLKEELASLLHAHIPHGLPASALADVSAAVERWLASWRAHTLHERQALAAGQEELERERQRARQREAQWHQQLKEAREQARVARTEVARLVIEAGRERRHPELVELISASGLHGHHLATPRASVRQLAPPVETPPPPETTTEAAEPWPSPPQPQRRGQPPASRGGGGGGGGGGNGGGGGGGATAPSAAVAVAAGRGEARAPSREMMAVQLQAALRALEAMQEMWGPNTTLPSAHELLEKETRALVLSRLAALQQEAQQLRTGVETLRHAHADARHAVFEALPAALHGMCESAEGQAELARLAGSATPRAPRHRRSAST